MGNTLPAYADSPCILTPMVSLVSTPIVCLVLRMPRTREEFFKYPIDWIKIDAVTSES